MKVLTNFAVELTMNLLIHTNGKTTTLEVKNELRNLGYFAEQKTVSVMMREIVLTAEPSCNYEVQIGKYNTYMFDEDSDILFNFGVAEDCDEDGVETNDTQINNTSTSIDSDTDTSDIDMDPIKIVYFADDVEAHDDASWVSFHKEMDTEFQIFDKNLTRDNVRNEYAKSLSVPIQDVRAKRVKNFLTAIHS